MGRRGSRLSTQEVRELWSRWKQGQTLTQIGAALGGLVKTGADAKGGMKMLAGLGGGPCCGTASASMRKRRA
jgi:hypothetical protein